MPGMSWPREMRPAPMAPTLMRLLGAYWPKMRDGTMAGNANAAAPAVVFRNSRRVEFINLVFIWVPMFRVVAWILPALAEPGRAPTCFLVFQGYEFRVLLRLDDQFGSEQALFLVLGVVGAVDDVGHEFSTEWKRHIVAVDIAGLLLIDDEEVIALLLDCDVGVLAGFNIAIGPQDEEPSISPGAEAIGRKPVEADR